MAAGIWSIAARTIGNAFQRLGARSLANEEVELLVAMAGDPNKSLNVDEICYDKLPLTKLEMLGILRNLTQKVLVEHSCYSSSLYSISAAGQQRALDLLKKEERAKQHAQ